MISLAEELMRCPALQKQRVRGSPELMKRARKLRARQWSVKAIARELDVAEGTVQRWVYR